MKACNSWIGVPSELLDLTEFAAPGQQGADGPGRRQPGIKPHVPQPALHHAEDVHARHRAIGKLLRLPDRPVEERRILRRVPETGLVDAIEDESLQAGGAISNRARRYFDTPSGRC